ncbi:hypothetical protein SAMN05660976_07794 [Nonomuraea pusilla]|uniref:Uncharacterized protein n=2 Tax=Nonomuraea pusilla TaxID=46177 RepID=A0A1H8HFP7_9ACTN|nr:hypothetical protein SAMN05660976_07794 [Nonomuraea pusilla]
MAFLVVLDSMTPAGRVAFIPRDLSRCSFAEVAEIAGPDGGARTRRRPHAARR